MFASFPAATAATTSPAPVTVASTTGDKPWSVDVCFVEEAESLILSHSFLGIVCYRSKRLWRQPCALFPRTTLIVGPRSPLWCLAAPRPSASNASRYPLPPSTVTKPDVTLTCWCLGNPRSACCQEGRQCLSLLTSFGVCFDFREALASPTHERKW